MEAASADDTLPVPPFFMTTQPFTQTVAISKLDDSRHIAFGWASVAIRKDGEPVVDFDHDIVTPDELEDAAYAYVLHFGEFNERHGPLTKGFLVESLVVTAQKLEKMGLPADALPQGWWVGVYIPDTDVWKKVQSGEYSMFSIEGTAEREEVA